MSADQGSSDVALVVSSAEIEEDRYSRLRLIHWWDQDRLSRARVLVVGAGALGNELIKNLALLGVGRVYVTDMDSMESSNLSRSVLFRAGDEGTPKSELVARRAGEINADTQVVPWVANVCRDIGLGVFRDVDVVIAGLDNREARLFINQACWKVNTPWIDGAIEVLMGVARVFVPGVGACYECTMSDIDYELLNKRRSCALLARADADAGKVPTTPTTASVIAGIEVQEFVKLLHHDRGLPTLTGKGFVFNGLTHDSYVVEYREKPDCLSHDRYEGIQELPMSARATTVGEVLDWIEDKLGQGAVLDLERELVVGLECDPCSVTTPGMWHLGTLTEDEARCPLCGAVRKPKFTHTIERGQGYDECRLIEMGIPPYDIITGRLGAEDRVHGLLAADRAEVMEGVRTDDSMGRAE
jgi:molybdopterin/thiamine biosynthesis adenylyltransferase